MSERPRFNFAPRDIEKLDALADGHGFADRSVPKSFRRRQRGTREQTHNFSIRVLIDDAELFVSYCETERLTYREAFDQMLRAAGIKA